MIVESLRYEVRAELCFSREEAHLMVALALEHYDVTCRMAGSPRGGVFFENGFLARLLLFSETDGTSRTTWTTSQIDLALKCIEPYTAARHSELQGRLYDQLHDAFLRLEAKWKELNG